MSVSNYTPSIDNGCSYANRKLKNVVYFVSKAHLKDVHIDNGQAYIDGLTEAPTRLDCFNIQFEENETLDERYKFTKSLRFSVNGYMNMSYFTESDLFYAIIETEDGTLYMINVDFPSRITYTYNLSANVDQTDFTFSTQSNFPSLRVDSSIVEGAEECKGYRNNGIKSLELIEKNYAAIEKTDDNVIVYTYQGKEFCIIDYMKGTCSLTESYNGETVTDTVTFDIGFDNYKTSWHYNLLEFLDNLYAARITPKSLTNQFFIGFDLGLQPSYSITADDTNGQTDKITVTLTDSTNRGVVAINDYEEEHHTVTTWRYVKWVGSIKAYECTEYGTARYLLQQEVDGLGNPTGRYKAYTGWSQYFIGKGLNVIGEFSESVEFDSPECSPERCTLNTNIPSRITFTSITCNTYNLLSSCDWNISGLPSYITATPSTGSAGINYTVTICNSKTPTSTAVEDDFVITYGDGTRVVNTTVKTDEGILRPSVADITCLEQNVTFTFDPNCPITVTSIPPELSYSIGINTLVVTVPRNYATSARSFNITVRDCNGNSQTVTINQDKTYERWVDSTGYICVGNDSYTRQLRYTGATASNINTPTGEYRAGTLIQEDDDRCGSYQTKWGFNNNYYCINGQKTECWEQYIRYGQGEWIKTGVTKLGSVVEDTDNFCDQEATYSWQLSTKWECVSTPDPPVVTKNYTRFKALDTGTFKMTQKMEYSIDSGTTWAILEPNTSTPTTQAGDYVYWRRNTKGGTGFIGTFSSTGRFEVEGNIMSIMFGADFEDGETYSGERTFESLFSGCTGLTSAENVVLPTTVIANCYKGMFNGCTNMTTAPVLSASTLTTSCYQNMFYGCSRLNYIKCLATNISASNCTSSWVSGVSSSGTFVTPSSTNWTTGNNGIPNGWTRAES